MYKKIRFTDSDMLLFQGLWVCVCIWYVFVCISLCVCMCVYGMYLCVSLHVCMVFMCAYLCLCMCVCISVCIVCMSLCVVCVWLSMSVYAYCLEGMLGLRPKKSWVYCRAHVVKWSFNLISAIYSVDIDKRILKYIM